MKSFIRWIHQFSPDLIWHQIFGLLIFLVVIPLLILGGLLIHTTQQALKKSVLQGHQSIVNHATGEIKSFVVNPRQALFVATSIIETLHADLWRQETILIELALSYPIFRRVASVNLEGKELVSSEPGTFLRTWTAEKAFHTAKTGSAYISEVRMISKDVFIMIMAVPVQKMGKVAGVIIAEVDVRGIWDIVDSIECGKYCEAYLVDERRDLIAHHDKKKVIQKVAPPYPDIIDDIFKGIGGSFERIDKEGDWLIAFAPLRELQWGLVIRQPAKEAYSIVSKMKSQAWILVVFSVIATVFMSIGLAQFISRPIHKIIDRTKRLIKGDFDYDPPVKSPDEIGRLLLSFNQMADQLRKAHEGEKLSLIGRVSTNIAHELKNSLLLVSTYVKQLPKKHKDIKFIQEFTESIPQELESWNIMLRGMMDISKADRFVMKKVNINTVVQSVALLAKVSLKQKQINFKSCFEEGVPSVWADIGKLKQVILNLMNNAIEATSQRGFIRVESYVPKGGDKKANDFVEVKISNTSACAIESVTKIFEPFYTTKSEGLGLGLATSKKIIEKHGGTIKIFTEPCHEGVLISFVVSLLMGKRGGKTG